MTEKSIKEVSAPYTVNVEDEAVGRETIIIRRNGEPVAVVVPFADYQAWTLRCAFISGRGFRARTGGVPTLVTRLASRSSQRVGGHCR